MSQPLQSRTVVVTRAADQQGAARQLLEQRGATVLDLPALVIGPPDHWGPLDDALEDLESFHWLVFSSANGVQAVEQRLQRLGRCLARRPVNLKIAAVGRKTAQLLDDLGATADFVPPSFVADSLIDHFPVSGGGLKLLLPRVQSGGRTLLADAFGEAGVRVWKWPPMSRAAPPRCRSQQRPPWRKVTLMPSPSAAARQRNTQRSC